MAWCLAYRPPPCGAGCVKPWQCRSWIFPRDPDFAAKAGRVLDLYDRRWNGRRLREDEYVISADEKSQLQALRRRVDLPPAPGRIRRQEFEYRRSGTLAYLAAYDVHRAQVLGRCAPTTGIEPFTALVEQVMTSEPYTSVFWIVDNGSGWCTRHGRARRGPWAQPGRGVLLHRATQDRQAAASPTSSEQRLLAFQQRYNTTAEPFDWRYTRKSLNRLLERLAAHEQAA